MSYPLSGELVDVLSISTGKPDDIMVFRHLAEAAAAKFGANADCVRVICSNETEKSLRYGALILHLIKLVEHDSAVRDLITVGHLGKLLARLEFLKSLEDYKLMAWPNALFDRKSQSERKEYFERNVGLPTSTSLLSNPALTQLRDREKEIMIRFGVS